MRLEIVHRRIVFCRCSSSFFLLLLYLFLPVMSKLMTWHYQARKCDREVRFIFICMVLSKIDNLTTGPPTQIPDRCMCVFNCIMRLCNNHLHRTGTHTHTREHKIRRYPFLFVYVSIDSAVLFYLMYCSSFICVYCISSSCLERKARQNVTKSSLVLVEDGQKLIDLECS